MTVHTDLKKLSKSLDTSYLTLVQATTCFSHVVAILVLVLVGRGLGGRACSTGGGCRCGLASQEHHRRQVVIAQLAGSLLQSVLPLHCISQLLAHLLPLLLDGSLLLFQSVDLLLEVEAVGHTAAAATGRDDSGAAYHAGGRGGSGTIRRGRGGGRGAGGGGAFGHAAEGLPVPAAATAAGAELELAAPEGSNVRDDGRRRNR